MRKPCFRKIVRFNEPKCTAYQMILRLRKRWCVGVELNATTTGNSSGQKRRVPAFAETLVRRCRIRKSLETKSLVSFTHWKQNQTCSQKVSVAGIKRGST